jgi:DNA-binding SARP family transcriptional activator
MTDFRLLGPLEVVEGGAPVALPAGQPSAVLARLLLDASRALSTEVLVDGIWGESPPASARKVLQAYVSQLRKLLGADRIETRAGGYAVRVRSEELDLARFEELTEAARTTADPASRSSLLADALALWRGAPLAEFQTEPFAAAAARRLEDLRISALEQRIDADLALARHERVVPELEALVAQEPLREVPRRQLMLALYRCGRQAEALAHYREGRRLIVEELGLEPSKALQELERAILRRDPALDVSPEPTALRRGPVVAASNALLDLLIPLCVDGRELLLVEVVDDAGKLADRSAELVRLRAELPAAAIRIAAFTSDTPADDLARLAAEQQAELLAVADPAIVPAAAACDVALVWLPEGTFSPSAPVIAPFGGRREEWAALELAAWLAHAHGLPLRLLGAHATDEQRDASRMLANASLALQRFTQVAAEPLLVPPGPDAVLEQESSMIVAALPAGELDASRRRLLEGAKVPVLLVRAGLRPSGVAPDHTLTRFSWSLRDAPG